MRNTGLSLRLNALYADNLVAAMLTVMLANI